MRSIEVSAKTREQAIDDALSQLSAERHEVHVEVLDEGSSGFLGFGARPVRLRVTLDDDGASSDDGASNDEPAVPAKSENRQSGSRRAGGRRQEAKRPTREEGGKPAKERAPEPRPAKAKKEPAPERTAKKEPVPERPAKKDDRSQPPREEAASVPPEMANESAAMLQTLVRHMGMEAKVEGRIDEEGSIRLDVDSEDSAILIGRKGQTLAALQYLLNRIMHREEEGELVERIIIDIEGYLDRRKTTLEEMAREMAEKVKQSGRRQRVKPMSAQERRIIHLTLQDDPGIKTFSVGNADARSVVIAPANESEGKSEGSGGENRSKRGGGRRGGGQRGRGGGKRNAPNQNRGRQRAD